MNSNNQPESNAQLRMHAFINNVRRTAQRIWHYMRTYDIAFIFTIAVILTSILWWWSHPKIHGMRVDVNLEQTHLFTHILPTLFAAKGPLTLAFAVACIIGCCAVAQHFMGRAKTLITIVVSALIGAGVGISISKLVATIFDDAYTALVLSFSLSPTVWCLGALFAAAAFMTPIWNQRVWLVGYSAIAVILLYGGDPADYCMLASALTGQALGMFFVRTSNGNARHFDWRWINGTYYEVRRRLAAIAAVLAFGPLVAAVNHAHSGILSSYALYANPLLDGATLNTCITKVFDTSSDFDGALISACMMPHHPFALVSLLIITTFGLILAWGMLLGRRVAAWISCVSNIILAAIVASGCVSGYDMVMGSQNPQFTSAFLITLLSNVIPSVVFALVLARHMHVFAIESHPKQLRQSISVALIGFVVYLTIWISWGVTNPQAFIPKPTLPRLLLTSFQHIVPLGFMPKASHVLKIHGNFNLALEHGLSCALLLTLLIALIVALRNTNIESKAAFPQAKIIERMGGESMTHMAMWENNQYWIANTVPNALAYRLTANVALTCTGIFGSGRTLSAAAREFARWCTAHSYTPAVYAVHEEQRAIFEAMGWKSLMVGTDMVINPRTWKTTGKKWQDIRTAINRAQRDGFYDVWCTWYDLDINIRTQLEEICQQWADGKALPEMRFTLGGLEQMKDPDVRILYAIDSTGTVLAVTSWLPTWHDGIIVGWTLDVMRHRDEIPNGIMEFLIARMAQRMHDEGEANPEQAVEFVSLSAAPLAGLDTSSTDILTRSLLLSAHMLEPVYGFASLLRFKRKFQPEAQPIYLCYPDGLQLANIGIAVLHAYLPELSLRDIVHLVQSLGARK